MPTALPPDRPPNTLSPARSPRSLRSARLPRRLAVVVAGLGLWAACGVAGAVEGAKPYRPVPAEVGAAVTPPPELVAAAQALHSAAQAKDAQAAFALLADKVRLVTSGLTPGGGRQVEEVGPWPGADAALRAIGAAFMEGEPPPGGSADLSTVQAAQAFALLEAATQTPEWGRDPLVKGATCTYRGLRWRREAGARMDDGARGLYAPDGAEVRAAAASGAPVLGRLKPGELYLEGAMDDLPEGWRAVRLPDGRTGAVPEARLRDAAVSGLCFLRDAKGGWRVVAVAGGLL